MTLGKIKVHDPGGLLDYRGVYLATLRFRRFCRAVICVVPCWGADLLSATESRDRALASERFQDCRHLGFRIDLVAFQAYPGA